jgi:hypothetical protein
MTKRYEKPMPVGALLRCSGKGNCLCS